MAKFSYTVKDINGKTSSDVADSFDRAVLIQDLQKKGFFVVNVQAVDATDGLEEGMVLHRFVDVQIRTGRRVESGQ